MPQYQTDNLELYEPRFVEIAEHLFSLVSARLPAQQVERHTGSFSVYGPESRAAVVKIIIYHPNIGKPSHDWPRMRDGVYVWVRADGPVGDAIWGDILPAEMPRMFLRIWRDMQLVHIAANPQADFAYFPIMAGDDLNEIAPFIVGCALSQ
jgi:hypothetical protein